MLVTISGLPGSGTSTVARQVAASLGVDHLDGGTVFRAMAAEAGRSLAEFGRMAEADDAIDRALDARLADRARAGGVVLESRLAGWLAHRAGAPGLKVWIACDARVRAARVAGRDGHDVDEAVAVNEAREASEADRYRRYYDIDIADLGVYDLVLDSEHRAPDDLVAEITARAATPT